MKDLFPELKIIINGGIEEVSDVKALLSHVDGVMLGRKIYSDPAFLLQIDKEIYQEDTNFDTTLKTWNLPTGPYVELPFLGPSSLRGSIGTLIDLSLDPISANINSAYNAIYYSTLGFDVLNTRYEFKDTIQSVLYDSFDSYESGKSYYLQRFEGVSLENSEDELFELYLSE